MYGAQSKDGHLDKRAPRANCHESSPAGTNAGGTGKLKNARLRSMIPYDLGKEILESITRHAF